MSLRTKNIHRHIQAKNQPFFSLWMRISFLVYILLAFTFLGYSLSTILRAEPIFWVVDSKIYTVQSGKRSRNTPTIDTVIGYHDSRNLYQRFTSTLDLGLPEGTEIPLLYSESRSWKPSAILEVSAYFLFVAKIAFSLLPLLIYLALYNIYRYNRDPESKDIFRVGLIYFGIIELAVFVSGYLAISGDLSVPVAIIVWLIAILAAGKFMGIVEDFRMEK